MRKEKTESLVGTCRFCNQQRFVEHADPELSQAALDEIASMECDCDEARRARELSNSVRAVANNINHSIELTQEVREAIIGLLKPTAELLIQSATIKVDDLTTVKVAIKNGRLSCVKTVKENTTIDEIGGR